MKKLIVLLAPALTLAMALSVFDASAKLSSPDKVKYAGDLSYKKFCEAVVKDDVKMLKRSVSKKVGVIAASKNAVLKQLIAADGMQCNGFDLVSFSEQRNASKISTYLSNAK